VEFHDLFSEIVHEGGLLHEVHENVLDLCHNGALDHLMEDFEAAIIGECFKKIYFLMSFLCLTLKVGPFFKIDLKIHLCRRTAERTLRLWTRCRYFLCS
jgi:hypothetical protein